VPSPPVTRLGGRHCLSWTSFALRHDPRPADTFAGSGSLRHRDATCGVWLPPARLLPPALPTLARRSVHGLHPSRSSLRRNRYPSRGPCPPAVTRCFHPAPKGELPRRGRLQGLVPATNPFCHRDHEDPSRRYLLGVRPSRACPHPTWRSLSSRRLPSRPWAA
jgi:hypothetical protein